jgi:hypothetical protein
MVVTTVDAALAELEEEPEGPEGETSLQLLQNVYRDRKQPLRLRVSCAKEALACEYPRVSAVAHIDGTSLADRLEKELRAIERSKQPVPLLNGKVEELPASELKKPFSKIRRF